VTKEYTSLNESLLTTLSPEEEFGIWNFLRREPLSGMLIKNNIEIKINNMDLNSLIFP
jgi:hypothetical protein